MRPAHFFGAFRSSDAGYGKYSRSICRINPTVFAPRRCYQSTMPARVAFCPTRRRLDQDASLAILRCFVRCFVLARVYVPVKEPCI
jgi:hypothetical protein